MEAGVSTVIIIIIIIIIVHCSLLYEGKNITDESDAPVPAFMNRKNVNVPAAVILFIIRRNTKKRCIVKEGQGEGGGR